MSFVALPTGWPLSIEVERSQRGGPQRSILWRGQERLWTRLRMMMTMVVLCKSKWYTNRPSKNNSQSRSNMCREFGFLPFR